MKLSLELTPGFTNVLNVYRHRVETETAPVVFKALENHIWLNESGIKPLLVPSAFTQSFPAFHLFYSEHTSLYYLYIGSDGAHSLLFTFSSIDKFLGY